MIKLNLNGLEIMNFFWTSLMSREKVSDAFLDDLTSMPEFASLFNEEFNSETMRKALSALSNKEPFKGSKLDNKFYSNNLMIMEYIDSVMPKLDAIKQLNLAGLTSKLEGITEIVIIPGNFGDVKKHGSTIVVDFFAVFLVDGALTITGKPLETAILEA